MTEPAGDRPVRVELRGSFEVVVRPEEAARYLVICYSVQTYGHCCQIRRLDSPVAMWKNVAS